MNTPPGKSSRRGKRILPDDWQTVQPLLDLLLDAGPDERAALLAQRCPGDPVRRAELERLVVECERDMPLLDRPAVERFDQVAGDEPTVELPGLLGGRYQITRELGRGGMARVYLAEDLKHARAVAVKVIRPELAASLGRDRFLREIGIAARLRHPNIMPLFDSGDADGVLYFVMPYEEGPSLRTRLDDGHTFSATEAVSALRDVAMALAYAHERGVVHRDVKPDNVMLSGGAAVVTDFGIAKAVSAARSDSGATNITQSGVGIGTPAYMAPEQAVGDISTDHRADIYSFGCLAYELLVGVPPFVEDSSYKVIAAHLRATPKPISESRGDVPEAVTHLVQRCLEKDPAARPQHARELLDVLASLPASGTGTLPVRRRSSLRTPAVLVVASVVLIGALVVLKRPAPSDDANRPKSRTLVVLPMDNQTGDAKEGYVAAGLAEDIARRLEGIGGIKIRSGARSEWPTATRHDLEMVASKLGSTYLLKTVLDKRGDSLEISAYVVDLASTAEKRIARRRFTTADLRDVESDVGARIAGAIFGAALPADPHPAAKPPDPESYRLTLDGWYQQLTLGQRVRARELFQHAVELDHTNARAWSGLSSAWSSLATAETVPPAEGYEQAESAAERALALDSTQGTAWANLGFIRATRYKSLSTGLSLIQKGVERDPGNPEVFLLRAALYRSAWRWDKSRDAIRVAEELDPITPFYVWLDAANEMCAGRFDAALQLHETILARQPSDTGARRGKLRALAALGRFDDAVGAWKEDAIATGDDPLAERLSRARGSAGYWEVKHFQGRRQLLGLKKKAKHGWMSPRSLMLAEFAAGELEAGYRDLERLTTRDAENPLYRLPCIADFDEVRSSPRFIAIQTRVGPLPP